MFLYTTSSSSSNLKDVKEGEEGKREGRKGRTKQKNKKERREKSEEEMRKRLRGEGGWESEVRLCYGGSVSKAPSQDTPYA